MRRKVRFLGARSAPMDEWLMQFESKLGNLVVYVPGYNIDFEKGCRRAAMLKDRLGVSGRLFLYSWPADGKYLNYTQDVADLEWSTPNLQEFLVTLSNRCGAGRIDLVAHSLGARGLVDALLTMATEGAAPVFRQVILVAPDIDIDVFRRNAATLSDRAEKVTVYVSGNDRALAVSKEVNHYPCLDQAEALTDGFPGMELVDLTSTGVHEISGHLCHLHNPAVVADMSRILDGDSRSFRSDYRRTLTSITNYYRMENDQQMRDQRDCLHSGTAVGRLAERLQDAARSAADGDRHCG